MTVFMGDSELLTGKDAWQMCFLLYGKEIVQFGFLVQF